MTHANFNQIVRQYGMQVIRALLRASSRTSTSRGARGIMADSFFSTGNKQPTQTNPLSSADLSQPVLRDTGISNRWRLAQLLAAMENKEKLGKKKYLRPTY